MIKKPESRHMYKITLNDCNRCPIMEGAARFFTEDIEEFRKRWFALEQDEYKKSRFLQSKNGECITDFCNSDASLNIVQQGTARIYEEKKFVLHDKEMNIQNFWDWTSVFYSRKLKITFQWICFQGKYYRIAKYLAAGICEIDNDLDGLYRTVECNGNCVLENNIPFKTKYRLIYRDLQRQGLLDNYTDEELDDVKRFLDPRYTTPEEATLDAFRDNSVQSICYVTNEYFETEKDLIEDISQFEVTDEVINRLLCDIVGECG